LETPTLGLHAVHAVLWFRAITARDAAVERSTAANVEVAENDFVAIEKDEASSHQCGPAVYTCL
jgi:hypothetical protein